MEYVILDLFDPLRETQADMDKWMEGYNVMYRGGT